MGETKKSEIRNIKSKSAHKRYLKLKENPLLVNGEIETSDPNQEPIRLGKAMMMGKGYFKKQIEHLPEDEQARHRQVMEEYKKLRGAIIRAGRDAFVSTKKEKLSESSKLLNQRSIELIELFGSFLTVDQVFKIATSEWGFDIHRKSLSQFTIDYEREIKKKKEEYKNEWNSLKLSHRRGRLEELQELYFDRKDLYYDNGKNRSDYNSLIQTLRMVREECQDPTLKIHHHVEGRIEATINHTIREDILKNLPLLEIIIGRVAAKLNTNPSLILERLHTSIYSKFSGIGTQSPDDFKEKPIYPSAMVYDWDMIEKQHPDQPEEDIEWKEVTETEKQKGRKMLDILSETVTENRTYLQLLNHNIKKKIEDEKELE